MQLFIRYIYGLELQKKKNIPIVAAALISAMLRARFFIHLNSLAFSLVIPLYSQFKKEWKK